MLRQSARNPYIGGFIIRFVILLGAFAYWLPQTQSYWYHRGIFSTHKLYHSIFWAYANDIMKRSWKNHETKHNLFSNFEYFVGPETTFKNLMAYSPTSRATNTFYKTYYWIMPLTAINYSHNTQCRLQIQICFLFYDNNKLGFYRTHPSNKARVIPTSKFPSTVSSTKSTSTANVFCLLNARPTANMSFLYHI